ncbi:MAG: GNAT family N-acetyltransferase [Pseudomonadota bacterium]
MMAADTEVLPDARLLDRPVWSTLSSRQAHLGVQQAHARAFRRDVAQFAAIDPRADPEAADLATLAKGRPEGLVLMQAGNAPAGPKLQVAETFAGVQMVASRSFAPVEHPGITVLCREDIPSMLSLVALAKPGPFKRETFQTGDYVGIKVNGHLVAMAGERLKMTSFAEISAVCTHPRFRGRRLAGALIQHVARTIGDRGETPFLHTYASNRRAIELYERLGFELRAEMRIVRLVAAS